MWRFLNVNLLNYEKKYSNMHLAQIENNYNFCGSIKKSHIKE